VGRPALVQPQARLADRAHQHAARAAARVRADALSLSRPRGDGRADARAADAAALVTGVGLLQLFQYIGLREYIGFTALLVGHVVICLPFAVRTVAISLHTLPPNVELAAASLGASRWRRCGTSCFR
jgi:hypothetical protein